MFDTNDFELDEIFSQPFESDQFTNSKRLHQDEPSPESNKRPCLSSNTSSSISSVPKIRQTTVVTPLLPQFSCNSHRVFQSPQRKVIPRKFPGPAGLLPEYANIEENAKDTKSDIEICSQIPTTILQEGAWEQLTRDFSCMALSRGLFLPDKYNIAWIKAKMKSNELINQKAPFLAAAIQKIDLLNKPPVVTIILKDATGEIHGTIVNDLYEEYMNELRAGSVVVLKQFGVFVTVNGSNYYVTITANNLVAIYSEEMNSVKVTMVQKLSAHELIKNIEEVKTKHQAGLMEQKGRNVFLNLRPLSNGNLSTSRNSGVSCNALSKSDKIRTETSLKSVISNKGEKVRTEMNSLTAERAFIGENKNMQHTTNLNIRENSKSGDSCSQVSIVSDNLEHSAILQNIFDGVDADLLFEDF